MTPPHAPDPESTNAEPEPSHAALRARDAETPGFEELTRGLLWPSLFRAPALALRPDRVGLGLITLVVLALLGSVPQLWGRPNLLSSLLVPSEERGAQIQMMADSDPVGALLAVLSTPMHAVADRPLTFALLGIPMLAVLALGVGAVCRSAAREFALDQRDRWHESLAFVAARAPSFVLTLLIPVLFVGGVYLLIAAGGFLLLTLPGVSLLGSVLFGLALLLGLLAAVAIVLGVLAIPLVVAAMACEGTDAVDAVQRSYAYAVARPLRLTLYFALADVLGLLLLLLVGAIAAITIGFTLHAASAFGGVPIAAEDASRLWQASSSVVGFWINFVWLIVAGIGFSYACAACTVVYLLIRRVVDRQDPADLWSPDLGAAQQPGRPA